MAHRPHAAGSAPSVAPPEMHPLCRECAGVSTIDEASPRPPETVLRVSDRLHRYACADMEWCCMCGYRTDAGYYLAPLYRDGAAVTFVRGGAVVSPVVLEFECVSMKTPEEEMARAMALRGKVDRKNAEDRAWMEDALAKLKGESFVEIARQKLFQESPLSVYIPPGGGVPQLVDPPLTYEEVRMRHDRDESDGARGRKHRDRAWLLQAIEQAHVLLAEMQREVDEWKEAEKALDEYSKPDEAEAARATERCAPGDEDDYLDHPDPRCDG